MDSTLFTTAPDVLMSELVGRCAAGGPPFLFVEDDDGTPLGIIGHQEIAAQLAAASDHDRDGWLQLPAEVALQNRLDLSHGRTRLAADPPDLLEVTMLSHRGTTVGLMVSDDVFVSWNSIARTLEHAHGDCITGLPDRATFERQLKAECNRALRGGHSVAVILLDLDHFKTINDTWGHAAGDAALRLVADTLRSALRSYDLVTRFGGDEFAVLCSGCRPGEIDIVVERLQAAVARSCADTTLAFGVDGISMGVCVAHDLLSVPDPGQLVAAADVCLYAAKEAGRDCAFKWECTVFGTPQPQRVGDRPWRPAPTSRTLRSLQRGD